MIEENIKLNAIGNPIIIRKKKQAINITKANDKRLNLPSLITKEF